VQAGAPSWSPTEQGGLCCRCLRLRSCGRPWSAGSERMQNASVSRGVQVKSCYEATERILRNDRHCLSADTLGQKNYSLVCMREASSHVSPQSYICRCGPQSVSVPPLLMAATSPITMKSSFIYSEQKLTGVLPRFKHTCELLRTIHLQQLLLCSTQFGFTCSTTGASTFTSILTS
jgi:hypothetical protein